MSRDVALSWDTLWWAQSLEMHVSSGLFLMWRGYGEFALNLQTEVKEYTSADDGIMLEIRAEKIELVKITAKYVLK